MIPYKLDIILQLLSFNEILEAKDLLLLANKLVEKIPDATNAKEYYKSYLKRKNIKLVEQSKISSQQPKTIENPYINDKKLVIIEHQYYRSKLHTNYQRL